MRKFSDAVGGDNDLSRRVIDYLCTNYAKKKDLMYYVTDSTGRKKAFHVHMQYRNQLKAYSKMLFDPFRRHERIVICCPYAERGTLETTVAQMNFFKWAIENKVLDWLNEPSNLKKVEEDMAQSVKHKKKGISTTVQKGTKHYNVNVTVRFL